MSEMQLLKRKKILKGKTVSTTDNLTEKKRITDIRIAQKMYVFESFWSKDRKNLYIDANDKNKIKLFYYTQV